MRETIQAVRGMNDLLPGSEDSGTRPPSGSTSVTGRLRPPYRLAMIFCNG